MPHRFQQLNVRVSDHARDIVLALQAHHGLSQAGVIELVLREAARREGLLAPGGKVRVMPEEDPRGGGYPTRQLREREEQARRAAKRAPRPPKAASGARGGANGRH